MDKIIEAKPVSVLRQGGTRRAAGQHLTIELSETVKLAWPMVLTQLAQVAMMTTDLAFIGHIGPQALAAAALAVTLYLVSFTFGAGLLAPIAPLAAQAYGAGNLAMVQRALRTGLWAALLLSFPIIAFAFCGEQILLAFGQAPDAARLAQQYLFGLALGVVPTLWLQAIRNFMGAVNRPEPILWITLAAIPLNAVLVYLLVYGKFGLPRLELFGAALASTLVNCAMFLAGLWFATMRPPFRDYHVLADLWQFDWPFLRQLIVIGTPNLNRLPDAVRSFVGCRAPGGPDQHQCTRCSSDCASDHRDYIHDRFRHQHGGGRARWPCGRPQRRSRHQASRPARDAARYRNRCFADSCGDRRAF